MIAPLLRGLARWVAARRGPVVSRQRAGGGAPSADQLLEEVTRKALDQFLRSPEAQKKHPSLARLLASRGRMDPGLADAAAAPADDPAYEPASFSARITRPGTHFGADVCHAGRLTAYTAETVADDALRAGRGARLELIVAPTASDAALARLREQLGWLRERGVAVDVHRGRVGWEDGRVRGGSWRSP
jgi:hypothetical protein